MTQARILEPEVAQSEIVAKHSTELIKFDVTEHQLARMRAEFAGITFDDSKNYEIGRKALATLRELRVGVKETHRALKAESLAYGRRVDAAAKHFTALLEEIEAPLLEGKAAVDTEKLRLKAEKEAAEKAAVEAQIRAEREAEEARLKAIRDAEQAEIDRQKAELEAERVRMAAEREAREAIERAEQAKRDEVARVERERVEAEQRAERERLAKIAEEQAATQRKLDAERAEVERVAAEARKAEEARQAAERRKLEDEQKAERDRAAAERQKIDEERRAVAAEKERLDRLEFERQAAITAEANARAKAERERVAAEEARIAQAAREAAAKAEVEAMRPDAERLHAFAGALRAVQRPILTSPKARDAFSSASDALEDVLLALEAFGTPVEQVDADDDEIPY